jgi:hypothetical protein
MYRPRAYRQRRWHGLLVAALIVAGLGGAAAAYFALIGPLVRTPPASRPTSGPSTLSTATCPTARLPDPAGLGAVASIGGGELTVFNLSTCDQSTPVASGAKPPVRFSYDGQWLAFGEGLVVAVSGGPVQHPFGSPVHDWEWSPAANVLAGVTARGRVMVSPPEGPAETLLPDGSGARHLAFAPDGQMVAIDRAGTGIQILTMTKGRSRTIFNQSDPSLVPELAGWSPDGRWVLFWRGPVARESLPLDAVPAGGGDWVNLFDPVLPYADFSSACGTETALTVGGGGGVSAGKQIVLTGPPAWQFHNLTHDYTRSWIWPACSPDGRWIAAVATPNHSESPESAGPRAIWLLATDGSSRRRLIPGGGQAPEAPRWSRDGRVLMVIMRSGPAWSSPGSVALLQVDRSSARKVRIVRPMIGLGPAPGPGGHQEWSAITDWYQPQ